MSRANAGLVVYLFENEVPEIQEGSVRIVAVAREANLSLALRGSSHQGRCGQH